MTYVINHLRYSFTSLRSTIVYGYLLDVVVVYCLNATIVRCIDCATSHEYVCFISVNTES